MRTPMTTPKALVILFCAALLSACGGQNLQDSALESTTITEGAPEVTTTTSSSTPTISSISPADGDTSVAVSKNITVTFSEAMDTSTITAPTSTTCSGSIQVSSDSFSTCVKMGTNIVAGTAKKIFTVSPSADLSGSTTYKVKVTTDAKSSAGVALASDTTQTTGFTTVAVSSGDTTAPTVSSLSPANGATTTLITTSIDVTFSEAMSTSGTMSTDTTCTDAFNLSSASGFTSCIAWSSAAFTRSNSNQTLSVTPGTYLDYSTKYYLKVNNGNTKLSDTTGNVMSGTQTYNFTTAATSWSSLDGGGTTGMANITSTSAESPSIAVYNDEVYVAYIQSSLIRVAKYSGSGSSWSIIDGGSGLNYQPANIAQLPKLIVHNSKLYVFWEEEGTPATANWTLRAKYYDGSSWNIGDTGTAAMAGSITGGATGRQAGTTHYAYDVTVNNSILYVALLKSSTVDWVYLYQLSDTSTWSQLGAIYLTAGSNHATLPGIAGDGTNLYMVWEEGSNCYSAKYTPTTSSWGSATAIMATCTQPSVAALGTQLYAAALFGSNVQIYKYTSSSNSWSQDGSTIYYLAAGAGSANPARLHLYADSSHIFATWGEMETATTRQRVAYRDNATSTWSLIDGNSTGGLNISSSSSTAYGDLTSSSGVLYFTWREFGATQNQIRVKKGL